MYIWKGIIVPPTSPFEIPCALEMAMVWALGSIAATGLTAVLRAVVAKRRTLWRMTDAMVNSMYFQLTGAGNDRLAVGLNGGRVFMKVQAQRRGNERTVTQ